MASAESQNPTCPVCHQADQVKTMQAAYNTGVARCAPPEMPTRNVSMLKYISICGVCLGLCVFCVLVLIGSLGNNMPQVFQFIIVTITLICLVTTLVTSYLAFQRIVRGDAEATVLFPVWDKATATWQGLNYCSRDDAVFDPKNDQVLTNEQVNEIRTSASSKLQGQVQHAQTAVASH